MLCCDTGGGYAKVPCLLEILDLLRVREAQIGRHSAGEEYCATSEADGVRGRDGGRVARRVQAAG